MPTNQNDHSADKRGSGKKKAQSPYLVLGIVFLAVAIGLSFGDSSAWVAFLAVGVTFLALSGTKEFGRKNRPDDKPGQTP